MPWNQMPCPRSWWRSFTSMSLVRGSCATHMLLCCILHAACCMTRHLPLVQITMRYITETPRRLCLCGNTRTRCPQWRDPRRGLSCWVSCAHSPPFVCPLHMHMHTPIVYPHRADVTPATMIQLLPFFVDVANALLEDGAAFAVAVAKSDKGDKGPAPTPTAAPTTPSTV